MTSSFKGSNYQQEPERHIGSIINVNKSAMSAQVQDSSGQIFIVNLGFYVGVLGILPKIGEQWVISKVMGEWALERRTMYQNPTTNIYREDSEPGDIVLSLPARLRVNGTIRLKNDFLDLVDKTVAVNNSGVYLNNGSSLTAYTMDQVKVPALREIFTSAKSLVTASDLAIDGWVRNNSLSLGISQVSYSGVGPIFTILQSGRYNISFDGSCGVVTTGRSFMSITYGPTPGFSIKRIAFTGEDRGYIDVTDYLEAGSTFSCSIYHTSSATRTFSNSLKITRLV